LPEAEKILPNQTMLRTFSTIAGNPYRVAGVYARQQGDLETLAGSKDTTVYISYTTLQQITGGNITCYEVVMPNPVDGFAMDRMLEINVSPEGMVKMVENSDRFSYRALYTVWKERASRTMRTDNIVLPYWENLADTLIGLAKELGVTYFKWDAISQYGCNSPDHGHGDLNNTPEERADAFAFQLGIYMEKIVNKVCAECPDVIVDFDITEGHRSVGLGFLSVGKYFLINNGPYYQNYNIPINFETDWTNIFVQPGAPRTWICRSPLTFDKWIPSVLFLTHYLPDDPINSQDINLASLILGQNSIWGDLTAISPFYKIGR